MEENREGTLLVSAMKNEFERYQKTRTKLILPEIKTYDHVNIPKNFQIKSLSSVELADQITLMDFNIFSRIQPRECLGQAWKSKVNKKIAPNILTMIQQFNNLTIFIQCQILQEKSLKNRGKALKHIIKMGERFRELKNYNSLCASFSALNSAPVHRLKDAWDRVPKEQIKQFEEFKVIFASEFNHKNLRQIFRNSSAPCIPHIGLFLQDLVFIDDGNSNNTENKNLQKNMVNFSKSVRTYDRIKQIRLYQNHRYENIAEKEVVQKNIN